MVEAKRDHPAVDGGDSPGVTGVGDVDAVVNDETDIGSASCDVLLTDIAFPVVSIHILLDDTVEFLPS